MEHRLTMAPRAAELFDEGVRDVERALQIHAHETVPDLGRLRIVEGRAGGDAGVVDQHVDIAVARRAIGGETAHRIGVGDVQRGFDGAAAGIADGLCAGSRQRRVQVRDDQPRALSREARRDRRAQPAPGARHQYQLVLHRRHLVSPDPRTHFNPVIQGAARRRSPPRRGRTDPAPPVRRGARWGGAAGASGTSLIRLLHGLVLSQRGGFAFERQLAVLQDVGVAGYRQRQFHVLFHQQDRDALLAVQAQDDLEDLLHHQRRQPHGRLVQQDHAGRAIMARPVASICCSPPDSVAAFCSRRSRSRGRCRRRCPGRP